VAFYRVTFTFTLSSLGRVGRKGIIFTSALALCCSLVSLFTARLGVKQYWKLCTPCCIVLTVPVIAIRFQGTGIRLSHRRFSRNSHRGNSVTCRTHTKFYPNRATNVEGMDWNQRVPHTKAWLSLHQFSWNSMLLGRVTWRSAIYRISAESVNKIWVLRVVTPFLHIIRVQAWLTDSIFTKLHAFSTCVNNYRISWKSDKRFSHWY
jgi:hypothetical protein